MKKMVFVLMAVLLVFKAGAQNTYDFEVDGLGYTLIPPSSQNSFWTAAVSVITEEKIDIVVPNQVTYNEQTLDVVKIEILHTPTSSVFTENKQNVRSILIPSSVNSAWLEDFPKLTSITPNDGLQELVLKNITSLLQLVVPNSIMRIGVSSCSSLHKLVVLDGIEELRWVNGSSVQAGPFNSPIDTLYCGRNMDMSETGFPNGFCFNLKSFEIGDNVTDLNIPHIGDSLDRLRIPDNLLYSHTSFYNGNWNEVVIEDSYKDLINYYHNSQNSYVFGALNCKKLYLGRNVPSFGSLSGCEQLEIGPLTEYISMHGYSGSGYSGIPGLNIVGDLAYIKLYRRVPPEIGEWCQFDNETYLNTPLFVPRGSLEAYRNSPKWGLFFNIVEFDWNEPYYQISATTNLQYGDGEITGDRVYHKGDTAILKARNLGWESSMIFYCWEENGEMVSRENPYSFVVNEERSLNARFIGNWRRICIIFDPKQEMNNNAEYDMVYYSLNGHDWERVPPYRDSVWIDPISFNRTLYMKAIPKSDDSFIAWRDKFGNVLSEDIEYSFKIEVSDEPIILIAAFGSLGVEEEINSNLYVTVSDKSVLIVGAEEQLEAVIYNDLGQVVYEGFDRSIPICKAGLYIVAIGNKRIKVVVE